MASGGRSRQPNTHTSQPGFGHVIRALFFLLTIWTIWSKSELRVRWLSYFMCLYILDTHRHIFVKIWRVVMVFWRCFGGADVTTFYKWHRYKPHSPLTASLLPPASGCLAYGYPDPTTPPFSLLSWLASIVWDEPRRLAVGSMVTSKSDHTAVNKAVFKFQMINHYFRPFFL